MLVPHGESTNILTQRLYILSLIRSLSSIILCIEELLKPVYTRNL
jgi:hypothetical protein